MLLSCAASVDEALPTDSECEKTDNYCDDSDSGCEMTDRYEDAFGDSEPDITKAEMEDRDHRHISTQIYLACNSSRIKKMFAGASFVEKRTATNTTSTKSSGSTVMLLDDGYSSDFSAASYIHSESSCLSNQACSPQLDQAL